MSNLHPRFGDWYRREHGAYETYMHHRPVVVLGKNQRGLPVRERMRLRRTLLRVNLQLWERSQFDESITE